MLQNNISKGRQSMVKRLYVELAVGLCGNDISVGSSIPTADWFRFDVTPLGGGYKLKN